MSTTPGMAPKGILHEQASNHGTHDMALEPTAGQGPYLRVRASNHGTHDMALEPTAGQGPYLRVRPRISAVNQGLRA